MSLSLEVTMNPPHTCEEWADWSVSCREIYIFAGEILKKQVRESQSGSNHTQEMAQLL